MNTSEYRRSKHSTPGRIPELDGIRAIAILLVIGCHYAGFSSLLWGLPEFGWVGVDIFFVLSGFLITSILVELRGTASPIKIFYIRRVLRIFPIYYLMILIVSVVSLASREHMIHFGWYVSRLLYLQSIKEAPALFHQVCLRLIGSGTGVALFHRAVLPLSARGADFGPWANSLSAAWSLSIEEYFYIIWAPIVILLKSRQKVVAAALLIFLVSIMIQYFGFTGQKNYFEFFCRMDTIMAGSMLALFLKLRGKLPIPSQKKADVAASSVGAIVAIVFISILLLNRPVVGHELRDSPSFLVIGLPALSILLALALGWVVLRCGETFFPLKVLRWRPARYLGTISYSLYLFHVPVYYMFLHLAAALQLSGFGVALAVGVLSLGSAITLSAISWKYFETPILNLKDRWAPTKARVGAVTTAA
ncbi:MAG: acyltransferase family protein [Terracidiphilus sp.]